MKTAVINLILFFQFILCVLAFAAPEEEFSVNHNIAQAKPALPENPFLQAEYLFHSGDFLAAKQLYHNYLSQNPSGKRSDQALFRLGSIDQSIKSYSTAARFYQIILQSFPRSLLSDSVRFSLAVCHYELADYNSAEANFKIVLRLSSDKKIKWKIMIYLAQIDGGRMNYEKAFTKLKQAHDQIENKEIQKQAVVVTERLINEKLGDGHQSLLKQKYFLKL